MTANFHEPLDEAVRPMPSDRACGLAVAALCLILAWVFRVWPSVAYGLAGIALLLAAFSFFRPSWLHPLSLAWMALGKLLHRVISPLIMGLLYFGVITPFGLLMRFWYDPLSRRRPAAGKTYWVDLPARDEAASMRNQF